MKENFKEFLKETLEAIIAGLFSYATMSIIAWNTDISQWNCWLRAFFLLILFLLISKKD